MRVLTGFETVLLVLAGLHLCLSGFVFEAPTNSLVQAIELLGVLLLLHLVLRPSADADAKGSGCDTTRAVARVANVRPNPGKLKVKLLHDDLYAQLRSAMGIPHDFLDDVNFADKFEAGTGKGGTLMAFVGSDYIVKELSKGDHTVLDEIAQSYFAHVKGGKSRLCVILMHYQDVETGRYFFVMKNAMGSGPFKKLYDLKGCDDDKTLESEGKSIVPVRKRIWHLHMWGGKCMWSKDRHVYHDGKVHARKAQIRLQKDQYEELMHALRRDTEWLAKEGLMDYSLLVGVKSGANASSLGGQDPYIVREADGTQTIVCASIIDFLQRWTATKLIAHYVKVLETNKATIKPAPYAERFLKHFERSFRVVQRLGA
eukprot:TRINITY_DN325_c0_g1_i1.p1 TRINITY_DN325_c0_g1~~TRINITY_DN325_c0_g1_i1.p1  ORF type:complete len:397 (+),score=69.93 TRINITY_DN325_c0_g1_i1:79-1191(+)